MTQEQTLIQQGFEFSNQSKSHIHYTKDLGGDGFTLLHIFLKPNGTFTGELQEFLYEDDGSQYDVITKEPAEEDESLE
jgi:hypothetical protein